MTFQLDGDKKRRIVVMISEEEYYFPAAKKSGDEFILVDTCSGLSCFDKLSLYDVVD